MNCGPTPGKWTGFNPGAYFSIVRFRLSNAAGARYSYLKTIAGPVGLPANRGQLVKLLSQ